MNGDLLLRIWRYVYQEHLTQHLNYGSTSNRITIYGMLLENQMIGRVWKVLRDSLHFMDFFSPNPAFSLQPYTCLFPLVFHPGFCL